MLSNSKLNELKKTNKYLKNITARSVQLPSTEDQQTIMNDFSIKFEEIMDGYANAIGQIVLGKNNFKKFSDLRTKLSNAKDNVLFKIANSNERYFNTFRSEYTDAKTKSIKVINSRLENYAQEIDQTVKNIDALLANIQPQQISNQEVTVEAPDTSEQVVKIIVEGLTTENIESLKEITTVNFDESGINKEILDTLVNSINNLRTEFLSIEPVSAGPLAESINELVTALTAQFDKINDFNNKNYSKVLDTFINTLNRLGDIDTVSSKNLTTITNDLNTAFNSLTVASKVDIDADKLISEINKLIDVSQTINKVNTKDIKKISKLQKLIEEINSIDFSGYAKSSDDAKNINSSAIMGSLMSIVTGLSALKDINVADIRKSLFKLRVVVFGKIGGRNTSISIKSFIDELAKFKIDNNVKIAIESISKAFESVFGALSLISDNKKTLLFSTFGLHILLTSVMPHIKSVIEYIATDISNVIEGLGSITLDKKTNTHFTVTTALYGIISDLHEIVKTSSKSLVYAILAQTSAQETKKALVMLKGLIKYASTIAGGKNYSSSAESISNITKTLSSVLDIEEFSVMTGILALPAIVGLKLTKLFMKHIDDDVVNVAVNKKTAKNAAESKKNLIGDDKDHKGSILAVILAGTALLVAGVYAGKWIKSHFKDILTFTGTLALFIGAVVGVYALASKPIKDASVTASDFSSLIAVSTLIMLAGASLFMLKPELIVWSLAFTLTLATFVGAVVGVYALVANGLIAAQDTAEGVNKLIAMSAAIMLIGGSLFMLAPDLLKWCFVFTLTLATFVGLVVGTYALVGGAAYIASLVAEEIQKLVVYSAITMLVGGALFMMAPQLLVWCFVFTTTLALFIKLVVSAYTSCFKNPLAALSVWITAKKIQQLVVRSALIMLIGAYFFMKKPMLMVWAFVFTMTLKIFMEAIVNIYGYIAKHDPIIRLGTSTANKITTSIALLGVAFWLVRKSMSGENPLVIASKFAVFALSVGLTAKAFEILGGGGFSLGNIKIGSNPRRPLQIQKGALTATYISGGLASLGIAFGIINAVITDPIALCGQTFALVVCTSFIAIAFNILGDKTLSKSVRKGSITAAAMGIGLGLLGTAFGIVNLMFTLGDPLVNMLQLTLAIGAAGLVFAGLGYLSAFIAPGAMAAAGMGGALILLGGAFLLCHYIVDKTDPVADFGHLIEGIVTAGAVFSLLWLMSLLIKPGSIAATLMSVALIAVSGAFFIVHKLVAGEFDAQKDFEKLGTAIAAAGAVFTLLGVLSIPIAFGAAAAVLMSVGLLTITGTFFLVKKLFKDYDPISPSKGQKYSDLLKLLFFVGGIGGVFTELIVLSPFIARGTLVAAAMAVGVGLITTSVVLIKVAVDKIKAIDTKALERITGTNKESNIFDKFFDFILNVKFGSGNKNALDSVVAAAKITAKVALISSLIPPICKVLGEVGETVAQLANHQVPIEWNLLGKPTKYRTLTEKDYNTAAEGVNKIITTLGGAVIDAYDKNPEIFKGGGMFGSSKFAKVAKSLNSLGPMIASIAEGVGKMAQLQVANDWDDKGKPISYRTLTEKDFTTAQQGVNKIVTTLGTAIMEVYDSHKSWFSGNILSSQTPFAKVMNAVGSMGQMISNIAQGVNSFASGLIPVAWDENGKPTDFEPVGPETYTAAARGIMNVISVLGYGIMAVHDKHKNWFTDEIVSGGWLGLKKTNSGNPFTRTATALSSLGTLIANITNSVITYASGKYAIKWDKDGKPIDYAQLTPMHFVLAALSVQNVISVLGDAIINLYKKRPYLFANTPEGKSKFQIIMEGLAPMGNMVKNITDGVLAYATGKVPTAWDKNGKPKAYRHLNNTDFEKAGNAIEKILSTVGNAIVNWATSPAVNNMLKDGTLTKAVDVASKISGVITTVTKGIQAYYELAIPVYKDGKLDHKEKLPKDFMTTVPTNIKNMLTNTADAVVNAFAAHKEWLNPEFWTPYNKVTKTMGQIIGNAVGIIKNIVEMKFPKYKADGTVESYEKFTTDKISDVGTKINTMFTELIKGFVLDDINAKHLDDIIYDGGNGTVISKLRQLINDGKRVIVVACNAISNFMGDKIPVAINEKTGAITKYQSAKDFNLNSIGEKVKQYVQFIPNLINDISKLDIFKQDISEINENTQKIDLVTKTGVTAITKVLSQIQKIQKFNTVIKDALIGNSSTEDIKSNMFTDLNSIADGLITSLMTLIGKTNDSRLAKYEEKFDIVSDFVTTGSGIIKSLLRNVKSILKSFNNIIELTGNIASVHKNITNTNIVLESQITSIIKLIEFIKQSNIEDNLSDIEHITDTINTGISNILTITTGLFTITTSVIEDYLYTLSKFNSVDPAIMFKNIRDLNTNILTFIANTSTDINNKLSNINVEKDDVVRFLSNYTSIINSISESAMYAHDNISSAFESYKGITVLSNGTGGPIFEKLKPIVNDISNSLSLINSLMGYNANEDYQASTIDKIGDSVMSIFKVKDDARQNSTITSKIEDFTKTIDVIMDIAERADVASSNGFNTIANGIQDIYTKIKLIKPNDLSKFEREEKSLDLFVKSVNSIDMRKMSAITTLTIELNKLTNKFGNLEKLTNAITKNLSETLNNLAAKITVAKEVIDKTDKMQTARHRKIAESIDAVQKLMNTNLNVTVKSEQTSNPDSPEASPEGKDESEQGDGVRNSNQTTQTTTQQKRQSSNAMKETTKRK